MLQFGLFLTFLLHGICGVLSRSSTAPGFRPRRRTAVVMTYTRNTVPHPSPELPHPRQNTWTYSDVLPEVSALSQENPVTREIPLALVFSPAISCKYGPLCSLRPHSFEAFIFSISTTIALPNVCIRLNQNGKFFFLLLSDVSIQRGDFSLSQPRITAEGYPSAKHTNVPSRHHNPKSASPNSWSHSRMPTTRSRARRIRTTCLILLVRFERQPFPLSCEPGVQKEATKTR